MEHKNHTFIKRWSEGYFDVNEKGHVVVKPNRKKGSGDLYTLIQTLVEQGIEPPILIRFNGILRDRIQTIHAAFLSAIDEFKYRSGHRMAFPIKVNPQSSVVEAVLQCGKEFNMGLEVGSKPELIAILTLETNPDALLLCNGYKDAEYISLALMARKLGKRAIIIIEQTYELKLVLDIAQKLGVEAEIGFRMKLSYQGTGRWQSSGGEHAKFGLFTYEIVDCLEKLKTEGKSDWLKLLHFHIGSQQTTIESIKNALNEAARMYTEIALEHPSLAYFDVGGGLAVDYDGTRSKNDSSMNYTVEEYARNVVSVIGEACLEADLPDPIIITESGRAIVSHHSVLIIEVIDVTSANVVVDAASHSNHPTLQALEEMLSETSLENCREMFHDMMELRERILTEFVHGQLTLKERAFAEKTYRTLLVKIHGFYKQLSDIPEEIEILDKLLLETYFCNFSVFQSLPDSWAIDQLFPVMPIHRLDEQPTHQGILADLTCDSDGKVNKFIGRKTPLNYLSLHEYQGGPYYIGIFLVGAYQEILGGLHNLFGDTNVVHAELSDGGKWELSKLVEGDTIEEVLHYAQYNTEKQIEQLHLIIEQSIKAGRITLAESAQIKKKFKQALESYTYLII
jgi:arginine decarboxylase